MKPLAALRPDDVRPLRGLLFDLDDTLLTRGQLTREAYDALWDLHDAGLILVAVTGRPSGWAEVIARQWPIAGVVAENGAVRLRREGAGISRHVAGDDAERRAHRIRLAQLVERMKEVVPEARLSDDVDARLTDVAWDIGERVRLPAERVAAMEAEIARAGARANRSSIHLHATYDTTDKASGALAFLRAGGEDAGAALARYAFIGDSANDAACFAAFRMTFGVANVREHIHWIPVPPRFVAGAPMGAGFAEIARALLASR